MAQLLGPGEIEVAPGARFGLVAQLLQGLGLELPGRGILRVGKDHVVHDLGHPAILALIVIFAGLGDDRGGAAHELHVTLAGLHRRQGVEVGGVAVEPAQVLDVHRLDVMVHRAVIAPAVPLLGQALGQLDHLGDLHHGVALVGQPQGLIVEVAVHVPLLLETVDDALPARNRPVMDVQHHLGLVPPALQGLVEVLGPGQGVADLGAAQGIDVVQVVAAVFRRAEQLELRQIEVHLRRGFGVRGQLKDEREAVDGHFLAGLGDDVRGRDQGDGAGGHGEAQAHGHLPLGPRRQEDAVHVAGPAAHGGAGHDVFIQGGLEEAVGRDDLDLAGLDVVFGDHALDAAIVVHVAVGIDHRHHRLLGPVLIVEVEGGPGGFRRDEGIDHNDAGIALDEIDVGGVGAPDLIDPVGHLEQAGVGQELGLAPEAGVDGLGRGGAFLDKRKAA